MTKLVEANKKIEKSVVSGYKKIEESAVGTFNKIADTFVDSYLKKDGESIEEAKERIERERKERENAVVTGPDKSFVSQNNIVEENMKKAMEASADARRQAGLE